MRVLWSPLALERVAEMASYIAQDRPAAAEQWVEEIFTAVKRLERFPWSGREVAEAPRADLREVIFRRYRILYRVEDEQISILTVGHGRELLDPEELDESS